MLEHCGLSTRVFLVLCIAWFLVSCTDSGSQNLPTHRVLAHGYDQYTNGRYSSAWKSLLDTIYYSKDHGSIDPGAYLLASALCVHAYQWAPTIGKNARCIRFTVNDTGPREVLGKANFLRMSMEYLDLANHIKPHGRIEVLIRCHDSVKQGYPAGCKLVDAEFLNEMLGK